MGFKKFFLITTGSIALSAAIVVWAYNAGYSGGTTDAKRGVEEHSLTTTESTSSPIPTPTQAPTPNLNPIVTCQFNYLPDRQMPLNDCRGVVECQLIQGGEWFLASSLAACKDAQNKLVAYMAAWDRVNPPPTPPTYTGVPYTYPSPLTLDTDELDRIAQEFQQELDYILNSPNYVPSQEVLDETAEYSQQLVDECKQDCGTHAVNWAEATGVELLQKDVNRCKSACGGY